MSQYIDGGVMDNLPIDAVTSFLARACADRKDRPPPETPHLIVAASLEAGFRRSLTRSELDLLQNNWVELLGRARTLSYNTKLDYYAYAESVLRCLHKKVWEAEETAEIEPIDVHVVPVKPQWLCDTFGFHPMLGFRRERQKRSIAHGCASTLLRFARIDLKSRNGWRIADGSVPEVDRWSQAFEQHDRRKQPLGKGACWLRPSKTCPFSREGLTRENSKAGAPPLPDFTRGELEGIWRLCPERETHLQKM